MTSPIDTPTVSPKLRALDPDLPMLAARSAMELDNFISTGETNFTAVKELSARLRNSFSQTSSPPKTHKALLDSSTVSLIGRALNSSRWIDKVSTVDQLSDELWDVAQRLDKIETEPAQQPIEKIRDFCVALSECAASYRQAFHDLRPSHPFRR